MGDSENLPKFRRNKQEKIDLIVKTFLKLVEKFGYAKVSTNMVASEANISIGTIYRYFPEGKAAILKEGFEETIDDFVDISDIIKIITERDYDLIRAFISKYFNNHKDYLHLHKAYDQALLSNKEIFSSFQDNIRDYSQRYIEIAKESEPKFASISPQKILTAIMVNINVIESLIHHHLFQERIFEEDEEFVTYLTKIFQFTLDMYLN